MTRYDLVVLGASGFTGQYVVREIARSISSEKNLTWAIAGRNMKKMQKVLATASKATDKDLEELPILLCDVNNEESLNETCQKAKLILNCVGPYRFTGKTVVMACIENKCHHVDISGEPQYLDTCQLLYDGKARENKVYIIGACGWDSIPAEAGVLHARKNFEGDINYIESYMSITPGPEGFTAHSTTFQSAIYGFANLHELPSIRKQLHPKPLPKFNERAPKRSAIHYSNDANGYCIPFLGSDRSVVVRTQYLGLENENIRPIEYSPYFKMKSFMATIGFLLFGALFSVMVKFKCGRYLLENYPGFFTGGGYTHEGPTPSQMAGTSFSLRLVSRGYSTKVEDPTADHEGKADKTLVTSVSGPEPGYFSTSIFMVQSAYTILAESDKMPSVGGVFPPGYAFRNTNLIERLQAKNIKFNVIENKN